MMVPFLTVIVLLAGVQLYITTLAVELPSKLPTVTYLVVGVPDGSSTITIRSSAAGVGYHPLQAGIPFRGGYGARAGGSGGRRGVLLGNLLP